MVGAVGIENDPKSTSPVNRWRCNRRSNPIADLADWSVVVCQNSFSFAKSKFGYSSPISQF